MKRLLVAVCILSLVGCAALEDARKWAGEQLEKAGKVIEDLKETVVGQ